MRSRGILIVLTFTLIGAWPLAGCTKSITTTNRYAMTTLQPGDSLLFFLDSQSTEKTSKLETRVVRSMTRALEEANAYVWVLSSKEFCPNIVEPFYSQEDILLLLKDARFKQRIKAKRIQYIVLVSVIDLSRGWSARTYGDPGGVAVYNKRDTEHSVNASVIDPGAAEIVGIIFARCSASSRYGFAAGASGGMCYVFPFAWYGGETEDLAIRTLATNVAKFLTDKDAVPDSKRPEAEKKSGQGLRGPASQCEPSDFTT